MKSAALFILFLALISCKSEAPNKVASVNPLIEVAELKVLLQAPTAPQLIDVRTPEEIVEGKISNAKELDFFSDDFSASIMGLDKSRPYVVYCRSGKRSAKAMNMMKEAGFANVRDLKGGYNNWLKAN